MFEKSLNLLKSKGIKLESGLTSDELLQIERIYDIKFPMSLKEFLMTALPISKGFYNWRDFSEENVNFIKQMIEKPLMNVKNMAEDVYWCDEWGEEPYDKNVAVEKVIEKLSLAPGLIPVYAHRYIPMNEEDNPPIISVHNVDIIYYGENLEDYFNIEFGNKTQNELNYQNIKSIQFWSDII